MRFTVYQNSDVVVRVRPRLRDGSVLSQALISTATLYLRNEAGTIENFNMTNDTRPDYWIVSLEPADLDESGEYDARITFATTGGKTHHFLFTLDVEPVFGP